MTMRKTLPLLKYVLAGMFIMLGSHGFAQSADLVEARILASDKDYDKAIEMYQGIYERTPDSVYTEYLGMLTDAKKYKLAEKLVESRMSELPNDPLLHIDMGSVYTKEKKDKKAKEQYDMIIQMINGDDNVTQRVVKAFSEIGMYDYAIQAYEKATQLLGNPYVYYAQTAKLYAKSGHLDKAIDALLGANPGQFVNVESAKALLLEIIGSDSVKLEQTEKVLIKRINELTDNSYYAEILTWIYTQQNDWDGALLQIEALDARNQEDGRRLVDFARVAANAHQYETAGKAYNEVIAKGSGQPYYATAKSEQVAVALAQLKNKVDFKPADVAGMVQLYDSLLAEFPKFYSSPVLGDYAMVEAQYGNDVPRAIELLQNGIDQPATPKKQADLFKLQMGDYYLLIGKIWDASLMYSQVDKDFRQDEMGEDARFRNAKLAYYRGDFDWAQRQLSILKASTSDLIANDALYLSVLITENVEDSNFVPLQRYAYADLLLFQNRDKEAEALLDSINQAFPKHPLNDDIIMQRAKIALKHHEYDKALAYLKTIYEKYSQDVLGDDAVFMMAEIYQNDLHKPDEAKHYYEQLIIDYPGSTYVQTARQRLADLNKTPTP